MRGEFFLLCLIVGPPMVAVATWWLVREWNVIREIKRLRAEREKWVRDNLAYHEYKDQ